MYSMKNIPNENSIASSKSIKSQKSIRFKNSNEFEKFLYVKEQDINEVRNLNKDKDCNIM